MKQVTKKDMDEVLEYLSWHDDDVILNSPDGVPCMLRDYRFCIKGHWTTPPTIKNIGMAENMRSLLAYGCVIVRPFLTIDNVLFEPLLPN